MGTITRRIWVAIALSALLAGRIQAVGPEPYFGDGAALKVDISRIDVGWPFEYEALDSCVIPVHMEIGYYVEVGWPSEDLVVDPNDPNEPNDVEPEPSDIEVGQAWDTWRIELRQVECGDIGKDSQTDWPCYSGCENIEIRANFDVKLTTKLEKTSDLINAWEAYFDGIDVVNGSGEWEMVKVCVIA